MARDTEQLVLQLSADLRQFEKNMTKAAGEADRAAQRVERRFAQMNQKITRDFGNFANQVNGVLAAIGVGVVVRDVTQLGDTWTRVGNRLAFAGVESGKLAATQQLVADIASRTRSDLESTADLFSRMLRSSEDLGASMSDVAAVTEIVSKALAGASESERMGAIRQLGQGLGSGRLQGDELRSILENSRPIAEAIAAEFDTTVGNLRELGKTGQLESRRVFEAILRAGNDIDEAFNRTTFTVADAFTRLRTEAARFVGTNDQTSASTRGLTKLIDAVATNFELLASAIVVTATVLGGAFAGVAVARAVGALTAMIATLTTVEARAGAASRALAFFGGPLGLALTVVGAGMAYLSTQTDVFTSSAQAAADAAASAYGALQFIANLEPVVGEAVATTAEYAGELKVVAGEIEEVSKLSDEAAAAIDAMSGASESAATATDMQSAAERRLASQLRLTNIQRIEAAILDQRTLQDTIRRDAIINGLRRNALINGVRDGGTVDGSMFGLTAEQAQQIRESNELVQLFSESLAEYRAGRAVDPDENASGGRGGNADPLGAGSAESRADALADLERAAALRLAQLRFQESAVREMQDAEEIQKRTDAYVAAGLELVRARAIAEGEVRDQREAMNAEAERSYDISKQQDQIDLARLQNNVALADQLQDQLEIRRRTRDLVVQMAFSEEQALAIATEWVRTMREAREIERAHQMDLRDLEGALELARARGDTRAEQAIARRLEIEQRIAELRQFGLSEEAATDRARAELEALESADMQGHFRDWFRGGVTAALDGDLGDFFQNWLQERAAAGFENALNNVADFLWESLSGVLSEVMRSGEGGLTGAIAGIFTGGATSGLDQLSAAASEASAVVKSQLASAAASAATSIGIQGAAAAASAAKEVAGAATKSAASVSVATSSALLAKSMLAAAAAAQTFAASAAAASVSSGANGFLGAIGSLFGGFFADGGSVNPGRWHIVGERGPEVFVPKQPGMIIPNGGFGGGMSVQYVDQRTIMLQGTGEEIAQMRRAMAEDLASRKQQIVQVVRDAAARRQLA